MLKLNLHKGVDVCFIKEKIFKPVILIGLMVVVSVGCEPLANEPTEELFRPSPVPVNTDVGILPTLMVTDISDPVVQALVLQTKTYLVEKFGLNLDEITLFSVHNVEWPDASLGCPRVGMMYAQVITPGYQIQLQANGEVFMFHTDTGNQVILCNANRPSEIFIPP